MKASLGFTISNFHHFITSHILSLQSQSRKHRSSCAKSIEEVLVLYILLTGLIFLLVSSRLLISHISPSHNVLSRKHSIRPRPRLLLTHHLLRKSHPPPREAWLLRPPHRAAIRWRASLVQRPSNLPRRRRLHSLNPPPTRRARKRCGSGNELLRRLPRY